MRHQRCQSALSINSPIIGLVQVIEPIQSRCAILRFTRLGDAEILARLQWVCQQEKVRAVAGCLNVRMCACHELAQQIPNCGPALAELQLQLSCSPISGECALIAGGIRAGRPGGHHLHRRW